MMKSGIVVSIFSAIYRFYLNSFLCSCISAFLKVLPGSIIYKCLRRIFLCVELRREDSVFYRILGKFSGSIFVFTKKIYNLSKTGVVYKGLKFLLAESIIFKAENFMFGGLFVIFICPHEMWNNAYGLIFAVVVSLMYLISVAKGKKFGVCAHRIWLPFILFIFAVVFSVVFSYAISDSIRVLMFFITSFILCTVVYGMVYDREKFDKICGLILLSLVVTGIIAVVQKIVGVKVDHLLTDIKLNGDMGRVYSTWANPNNYAEFLILFFPFCFAFAVTREEKQKRKIALFALVIPFLALLFTYSRSGWLGFAVTAITFIALYNKKMLVPVICIGVLMLPLLPSSVLNRIMTIGDLSDTSSSYRITIWTGAMKLISSLGYKGTGLGPESFKIWYSSFAEPMAKDAPHTHMLFMEVYAEMGLLGIITFAALILSLIGGSCKAAKRVKEGKLKLYTMAAASSMMGILTIGFAEYVWFYPRVMFAFFVVIGLAMAAVKLANQEKN